MEVSVRAWVINVKRELTFLLTLTPTLTPILTLTLTLMLTLIDRFGRVE